LVVVVLRVADVQDAWWEALPEQARQLPVDRCVLGRRAVSSPRVGLICCSWPRLVLDM
jgi:hypothetical protein